ncbi:hypothetical protein BT93_A0367 [Corymbia citriodora subsp. variegata]|nr:hypothetical protein BT93_A0367 [Corymbia citriodora subsp. variegata]
MTCFFWNSILVFRHLKIFSSQEHCLRDMADWKNEKEEDENKREQTHRMYFHLHHNIKKRETVLYTQKEA